MARSRYRRFRRHRGYRGYVRVVVLGLAVAGLLTYRQRRLARYEALSDAPTSTDAGPH
jgi:hypothetical protein